MLDQSLLQSHFIGRDGFRWWIGQIPPLESMGKQIEGGGWGNRFKVRIIGYHPYSEAELPNGDLPWAQVLIPTTAGSGAANAATGVQLQPGDIVLGFFLDGDSGQIPVILATFGRTSSVSSKDWVSPFVPFTGFNTKIEKKSDVVQSSENNELTKDFQPTPVAIPPEIAEKAKKVPESFAIGSEVVLANTINNTKVDGIKSEVTNLLKKIKRYLNSAKNYLNKIRQEIRKSVDKIVSLANDFVGQSFNFLYKQLETLFKKGLELLYKKVYAIVLAATGNPAAAHLAGVAAQTAMVVPVKLVEEAIPCVAGLIMNKLEDVVSDLLYDVVENIDRFVSCASDQFIGSFLNDVIDKIEGGLSSVLGGVEKILQFFSNFSVGNILRSSIDALKSIGIALDCNQSGDSFKGMINSWVIGAGSKFQGSEAYQNILDVINIKNSGQDLNDVLNCFTGAITNASAPVVNIFGGGSSGSGATAVPIFGSYVKDDNGILRASVIGIEVTNGGSGYTYPPFIEIVDDANQGYGAVARALINDNGEVSSIYVVSEGENYTPLDIKEYYVTEVIVEFGGSGYSNNDKVIDNFGNEYKTEIVNGSIYNVEPINITDNTNPDNKVNSSVSSIPILSINSESGSGAILRPILGTLEYSGKIKSIINCVV